MIEEYRVFDRAVCGFVPLLDPIRPAPAWAIFNIFEPSIKRERDEIVFQEPVLCAFEPVEKIEGGYRCAIKSLHDLADFYVDAKTAQSLELKRRYEGVFVIQGGVVRLTECRKAPIYEVKKGKAPVADAESLLKIAEALNFRFGLNKRGTIIRLTLKERPEVTWFINRDGRVSIQCTLCYKKYFMKTLDGEIIGPFASRECKKRPCIVFPECRVRSRRQILNAISVMKTIRMKELNHSIITCEKLRHYYKPYLESQIQRYPPCQDCPYQQKSFCRNPHIRPIHRLHNTNRPPAICKWVCLEV